MKKIALSLIALLVCTAAYAQDVNWTVVLNSAGTGQYQPILNATVNGQPYDLSKGAGMSVVIGPNVYYNSAQYGYIVIQIPPDQPWNPSNSWYSWLPTPGDWQTPPTIQRGTPQSANDGNVLDYVETDTFTYEFDLTFYSVWKQNWSGTLIRNLHLVEKCGRWPCKNYVPVALCTRANNCSISYADYSATAIITGTFPVPTAPAASVLKFTPTVASLYKCGSARKPCFN